MSILSSIYELVGKAMLVGKAKASCAQLTDVQLKAIAAKIAAKRKPERPYPSSYEEGVIDGYNEAIVDVLEVIWKSKKDSSY